MAKFKSCEVLMTILCSNDFKKDKLMTSEVYVQIEMKLERQEINFTSKKLIFSYFGSISNLITIKKFTLRELLTLLLAFF